MKIIREAKVYLIGCQETDMSDLPAFLKDHDIENWETDTQEGSERLPEIAGRVCYMSFANPRPGGNKAYLDHILKVGHGSVLEHSVWNFIFTGISRSCSHELVRHRVGWSYCLAGETIVYSGSKVNGRFDGKRRRWTMKQLYEMNATPHGRSRLKLITVRTFDGNHFVQSKLKGVSASGMKQLYRVTLADGKSIRCSIDHRFLTPTGWAAVRDLQIGQPLGTNGLPAVGIQPDWLEKRYQKDNALLSEIAAEASCSIHTVRKYVRKFGLQKPQGSGMIGRTPPNKGIRYTTGYKHSKETKKLLGDMKRGEKNPQWKGDEASPNAGRLRAWRAFPMEPCVACGIEEGHRHHKDRNTLNNVRSNIEFLCNSCHTLRHYSEDGPTTRLTVKWAAIESIKPDGCEMTYDLEVFHESHNFVANGFVTHNSQLSQRYVDESVAEYVVPHDIADDEKAYPIWENAIYHAHGRYIELVNRLLDGELRAIGTPLERLIPEDRTALRKKVRQAARSVLPNATETKIFATANCRSLRHFVELRASRHAEPEIRKLAVQLLKIMQEAAPNLFSDYQLVPLPDGTFEAITKHRKV